MNPQDNVAINNDQAISEGFSRPVDAPLSDTGAEVSSSVETPQVSTLPAGSETNMVDSTPEQASTAVSASSTQGSVSQPAFSAVPPQATSQPETELLGTIQPSVSAPFVSTGRRKKPWVIGAILAVVVTILAVGAVFGYYLPNTPARVWSTGMSRSGKALATVVEKAAEPKTIERYAQSKMSLDASLTWGETTAKLTWNGMSDDKNAKGKLVLSASGGSTTPASEEYRGTLEYLLQYAETKQLPDLYFKASDLQNISLSDYSPELGAYVNKWIFVSADALKEYYPGFNADETSKDKRVNSQDLADAAKTLVETAQDYVLTSDGSRAVIVQKNFVGKETVDGVKTYHFKAGINRDNAKKYCEVLVEKIASTSLYKKLADDSVQTENEKKASIRSCQQSVDETVKDSDVFDVWIHAKYKLVHKVRIPAEQSSDVVYTEIGQNYKGGDTISLFTRYHDGGDNPYDAEWTLETNTQTGVTTSKASGKPPKLSEDGIAFQVTFTAEPTQAAVDSVAPKDAVPIQTILGELGRSTEEPIAQSSTASGSIGKKAKDTERQTDIHAIQAHTEAFYAQHGYYPTLADLQDSLFREEYMKDLDATALIDPDQTSGTIQATSGQNPARYGYVASSSNMNTTQCRNTQKTTVVAGEPTDNGCDSYILEAILSDGTVYRKDSAY